MDSMSAPASTAPMNFSATTAAHHSYLAGRQNSGATAVSETST
jgi:hypothetical protein